NLGKVTNGVVIVTPREGSTQTGFTGGRTGKVRPSVGKYGESTPGPPPSAAGFVHAAFMPGASERPKRLFAGGGAVARNEAYVITQPMSRRPWHSGMLAKSPPMSLPAGTCTLVPSRIAETSRSRSSGLPSISFLM